MKARAALLERFRLAANALSCGAFLWVAACAGARMEPPLRAELDLPHGETVRVDETSASLRFESVASDSRCPVDVSCVWAGNAVLRFQWIENGAAPVSVVLNTHGGSRYPKTACARGHVVELVALNPQPTSGPELDEGEYVATILVTDEGCESSEGVV